MPSQCCIVLLQAFYKFKYGSIPIEPLSKYVHPGCPAVRDTKDSWLYNPATNKCYYKATFARGGGLSLNKPDAMQRCAVSCHTFGHTFQA
jgi:hypothetical protein